MIFCVYMHVSCVSGEYNYSVVKVDVRKEN